MKFILSQDIALKALTDKSLRFLLNKLNMKLTLCWLVRNTTIPNAMELLYNSVEKKISTELYKWAHFLIKWALRYILNRQR